MFLFHENFIDVFRFECFLWYLFVVRHPVLVMLVAKVLDVFEHDLVGLVVDAPEKSFKALPAFELNVDFVGEEG